MSNYEEDRPMNRIFKFSLYGFIAIMFLSSAAIADQASYGKQKVVYHINYDNPKAQTGALRNIQNHIAAEFSFGGVTPYLGYSEKKMNGKTKKDKTTFVGVRGSVGDTGFGSTFSIHGRSRIAMNSLNPQV